MDDYAWWRAALAGNVGPIHDGQPQCGRYRVRWVKGGPWLPVAIWRDADGAVQALVDHDLKSAVAIWTRVARHPVSDEEYTHRLERGTWPGDAPAPTPAPIGDNNPPEEGKDTLEELTDRIQLEMEAVENWCRTPREGRLAGDMAANWLNGIRQILKRMDECHEIEKRPHLEAGRKVDERWRRPRDLAERCKQMLADVVKKIAQAERDRQQAALEARGPVEQMITQAIKPSFGGATGNKISLKQTRVAEIIDWKEAAAYYADNAKVQDLIQKLANADARNGQQIPGARIQIVERV